MATRPEQKYESNDLDDYRQNIEISHEQASKYPDYSNALLYRISAVEVRMEEKFEKIIVILNAKWQKIIEENDDRRGLQEPSKLTGNNKKYENKDQEKMSRDLSDDLIFGNMI